ncbi:MAG: azurin [Flavobacteriaceae bacterium]|nr:azurin [Flavobacteriaceae bacterium]
MKFSKYLLITVLSFFVLNCGGEDKKEEKKSVKIQSKSSTPTTSGSEDMANLTITGNDLMQYNKDTLTAKAGEKVKLTLTHVGKLDKQVMGHNVVILTQDANPEDFAAAAATARENDYIPADMTDKIIAHTQMIGGGQSTSVEFTAPTEPGTYEFFCSFPGHFQMMRGKFIVE